MLSPRVSFPYISNPPLLPQAPIGLNELYLQEADLAPLLAAAAAAAPNKTGDVLAAWGAVWSKAATTARLPGRAAAADLCARRGGEAWLDCGAVARDGWWAALAGHKFMLDPAGHGVQSPKWYEALLAGALLLRDRRRLLLGLLRARRWGKGWAR